MRELSVVINGKQRRILVVMKCLCADHGDGYMNLHMQQNCKLLNAHIHKCLYAKVGKYE